MLQDEFIPQSAHTWRVFARLVRDFDPQAWYETGRNANTPVRLSFHILKATKYYLGETAELTFRSGKPFDATNGETAPVADLPSQEDILDCIELFSRKTETWLREIDYLAPNPAFPWAGSTQLGLVLFVIRHSLYHLGELSALLNESRNGNVADHYVQALEGD